MIVCQVIGHAPDIRDPPCKGGYVRMAVSIIKQLCRKYTDLNDADIAIIETMSRFLKPVANLVDADIFIDCPGRDGDAIVVAEAKPSDVPSSYKKTVVGMVGKDGLF